MAGILRGIVGHVFAAIGRCRSAVCFVLTGLVAPFAATAADSGDTQETWRIGLEESNPPLSFTSPAGKPDGFAFELLEALFHKSRVKPVFVVRPWPELYRDFLARRIDVIATAAYSDERRGSILLSSPYFERKTTYFHRGGLRLANPPDLQGLRLAAVAHSQACDYLVSQGLASKTTVVANLDEALKLVDEGKVDVAIGGRTAGFRLIRELNLTNVRIHTSDIPGIGSTIHFGVRPEEAWRLAILNTGLERLRSDGSYTRIREQWYGSFDAPHRLFVELLPYLAPAVALLLLAAVGYLSQRTLYRRATESEERLNLVLEGSYLASWDWNIPSGTIRVSPRWHDLLGKNHGRRDLNLESAVAAADPGDAKTLRASLQELAEHGRPIDLVVRAAPGAKARYLHIAGAALRHDSSGKVLRAAGTLGDVTERMRTLEALNDAQARSKRTADLLRLAESAAHTGAWELDPRSNDMTFSDEARSLLGGCLKTESARMESFLKCLSGDSGTQAEAALRRAVSAGSPFDIEIALPPVPGQPSTLRWIGLVERNESGVSRVYGSLQDVTEIRRRENERTATLRRLLETQRREGLGTLAGGIAHDFNNLLTVILSNASLAKLDVPPSHQATDPLSQIERAATRAADLCRQMLIYAGQAPIDPKPVRLGDLLDEMRGLIDVTVGRRNRLTLDPGAEDTAVLADHRQLRQLILSIVQNAAEACPPDGGSVRIVCSRAVLTADDVSGLKPRFEPAPGPAICLSIEDDGTGMTSEVLDRIFEPFFSTKFAGRGLGLAAAHGIVRAHHGAITVESELHKGTTFRIYLPTVEARDVAKAPSRPHPSHRPARSGAAAPHAASPGLLVVDDDDSVRSVVSMLAERLGHRCVQASNGIEAYALFAADPGAFSTVMIDATMPGLASEELASRIREIKPAIRVIFMSGYHEAASMRPSSDSRVGRLTKPFTAAELAGLLGPTSQSDLT